MSTDHGGRRTMSTELAWISVKSTVCLLSLLGPVRRCPASKRPASITGEDSLWHNLHFFNNNKIDSKYETGG